MSSFFFFNDTATTEIYTLSLHDALPISLLEGEPRAVNLAEVGKGEGLQLRRRQDRKSTRLNSSHLGISYAVFCLKKKKEQLVDVTFMLIIAMDSASHAMRRPTL